MKAKLVFIVLVLLLCIVTYCTGCTQEPPTAPIPLTEQVELRRTRTSISNSRNFDEVRDIVKTMSLANYDIVAIYRDYSGSYEAVVIVGQKKTKP